VGAEGLVLFGQGPSTMKRALWSSTALTAALQARLITAAYLHCLGCCRSYAATGQE
jgi:hypothetical protein